MAPIGIVFQGGPNDGRTDSYDRAPDSIGASDWVGDEVRGANGTYGPTDRRDDAGRVIYEWRPASEQEVDALIGH